MRHVATDFEGVTVALSVPAVDINRTRRWRLGVALWGLGIPGIVAVLWAVVPALMPYPELLAAPVWAVVLLSGVVAAGLLAFAVAVGVALAPRAGLAAPAVSAWAQGLPVWAVLKPSLVPATVGGLAGAAWWWVLSLVPMVFPDSSQWSHSGSEMPWVVKLLYSGITEEILVRWGLMTWLLWLGARWVHRGDGMPSKALAAAAVVFSALLFALVPLVVGNAMASALTVQAMVWLLVGHAGWGLIAGGLYARYGLEAAILAHVLAQTLWALVR